MFPSGTYLPSLEKLVSAADSNFRRQNVIKYATGASQMLRELHT
jgi:hypothetical protein